VHPFEKRQAVAVTLGASYDDWALSELAGELGKKDDQHLFASRALNFRNLWDSSKGFFMPRDAAGHWIDIDPKFDGGPGGRNQPHGRDAAAGTDEAQQGGELRR